MLSSRSTKQVFKLNAKVMKRNDIKMFADAHHTSIEFEYTVIMNIEM